MATRFYFPSSGSAAVSPTYSAEWEHNRGVRLPLTTTAGTSTLADIAYDPDSTDHLTDEDSLFVQFVSAPIDAITLTAQTVTWQFQCAESGIANNLFLAVKVFTVSRTGTVKNTVLAIKRDATEATSVSVNVTNRNDTATSTEVTVASGDRLVIEVGLGGLPTTGGSHNGVLRIGENAIGDLPVNNTAVDTNLRPWLEFGTSTMTFQSEAPDGGTGILTTAAGPLTGPFSNGGGGTLTGVA
jgi:hypothetical protein